MIICQSFSNIEFKDELFWSIIESKFNQELNENPKEVQSLAAISFALENAPEISQKLKNKLCREISRNISAINEQPQFKDMILAFASKNDPELKWL